MGGKIQTMDAPHEHNQSQLEVNLTLRAANSTNGVIHEAMPSDDRGIRHSLSLPHDEGGDPAPNQWC
eukprot:5479228-Amphidinium_carterae.1